MLSITSAGWKILFTIATNFEKLHLKGVDLTDIGKLSSLNLPQLVSFKINRINGSNEQFLLQVLKAAVQLRKLKINDHPKLTDQVFKSVISNRLIRIDFSGPCYFRDRAHFGWDFVIFLDLMKSSPVLQQLVLKNCNLGYLFLNIQNMSLKDFQLLNLRILKLDNIDMREMCWAICYAPYLEELRLDRCRNFDQQGYQSAGKICNLKLLDMYSCTDIPDEAIRVFISNASKLSEVRIKECTAITSKIWIERNFENMREFYFKNNLWDPPVFSISDLGNLIRTMPNLQYLHLCNSVGCTYGEDILDKDEDLGDLATTFQKLKSFSIGNFENFTHFGLLRLLMRAPELEEVKFRELSLITNNITSQLFFNCSNLKKITFDRCLKINTDVLEISNENSVLTEKRSASFS